jgi:hypothetical protein
LREDLSRAPKGVTLLGIVVQIPGANIKGFLATILIEARRVIQLRTRAFLNLNLNLNRSTAAPQHHLASNLLTSTR